MLQYDCYDLFPLGYVQPGGVYLRASVLKCSTIFFVRRYSSLVHVYKMKQNYIAIEPSSQPATFQQPRMAWLGSAWHGSQLKKPTTIRNISRYFLGYTRFGRSFMLRNRNGSQLRSSQKKRERKAQKDTSLISNSQDDDANETETFSIVLFTSSFLISSLIVLNINLIIAHKPWRFQVCESLPYLHVQKGEHCLDVCFWETIFQHGK